MPKLPQGSEPIIIKFVRCYQNKIGIMVDEALDCWGLNDLREWSAHNINFVVIDDETGEDITRILLA